MNKIISINYHNVCRYFSFVNIACSGTENPIGSTSSISSLPSTSHQILLSHLNAKEAFLEITI